MRRCDTDRVQARTQLVATDPVPSTDQPIALTVVIPAFDEQARLPAVLRALEETVDPLRTELVVVDDGSSDATAAVAEELTGWAPHRQVISHRTNRGKGAAVRSGVAASRGDRIAFVDADNATNLDALDPMAATLGGDIGAVVGSRHAPGAVVTGAPPIRGVMGRLFNHVVRVVAGTRISDTQCGAKMFTRPVAKVAFSHSAVDGFAFDVEVLRRVAGLGFDVVEHPVRWSYVSGTKIGLLTPASMVADIIGLRLRPGLGGLDHVDGTYSEGVGDLAEPLHPDRVPAVGDPCRVLLPEGWSGSIESLVAALGTAAKPGRGRPWGAH